VDERDSTETALKSRDEIVVGQIAFQSHAFLALAVEQKHRRSPGGFETMEPRGMFLDVGFDGQEILVDELGGFLVLIGLGIQPSAGASGGSRTEVQQNGMVLLFSCNERLIDVFAPTYGHNSPP